MYMPPFRVRKVRGDFTRTIRSKGKLLLDSTMPATDTEYYRSPVDAITSPEGQKVQKQIWSEILEVLQKASPEVAQYV